MNCYINYSNDKYYCLNPIDQNLIYYHNSNNDGENYLCSYIDDSKNLLYSVGGPAIDYFDGTKKWYYMGKLHREDGPALQAKNYFFKTWYYHGEKIHCNSQEEFEKIIKMKAFL